MGQKMASHHHSADLPPGEPLLLSQLLQQGRLEDVERHSRVKLPGIDVESFSGYVTVDPPNDGNLFFWFFPATKVPPAQAPLILYLNGGPGNSSLIGLFEEVGPLKIDGDGKVHKRLVTWTDHYNVVFVDNPVFVGFSYAKPGHESRTNAEVVDNLYSFVTQFLQLYPSYQDCDFYIAGVSFAGKYVPALASKIHAEMELPEAPVCVSLRGVILFSGLFDPEQMFPHYPKLLSALGLLSEKQSLKLGERITYALDKHKLLGKHEEAVQDIMDAVFTQMHIKLGYESLENLLTTEKQEFPFTAFLNKPDIQRAIHARACRFESHSASMIQQIAEDFFNGVGPDLRVVLENNKVLICSGQLDLLVSVPMTESFLHDLRWSGTSRYLAADRSIWRCAGHVAGYVTEVKNLTRVVMRNAGHRPPRDQPEWTLDMLTRFIGDQSLVG